MARHVGVIIHFVNSLLTRLPTSSIHVASVWWKMGNKRLQLLTSYLIHLSGPSFDLICCSLSDIESPRCIMEYNQTKRGTVKTVGPERESRRESERERDSQRAGRVVYFWWTASSSEAGSRPARIVEPSCILTRPADREKTEKERRSWKMRGSNKRWPWERTRALFSDVIIRTLRPTNRKFYAKGRKRKTEIRNRKRKIRPSFS